MANYTTEPKIEIRIDCLETNERWRSFDRWFESELGKHRADALPLDGKGGCGGCLDVPDAEKVVEWLKAHGVEPRK